MIAIGIVNEGYDTSKMPGWENGTVGYQTDGNIYDAENKVHGRPTKGQSLEIHCGKRFSKRAEKIQSMPFRNQVAYSQTKHSKTREAELSLFSMFCICNRMAPRAIKD